VIGAGAVLDGRLALFHKRQRWLAVADLHFGYELSQRAAGNLFPLWGMQTIEERLAELLADYEPRRLIILGDLVHDRAAVSEASALVERLRKQCEVLLISGNHDRGLSDAIDFADSWRSNGFYFHHGHCAVKRTDCVQIIGHHHPAGTVRDGAGLHLKLPAFVQQKKCWIMPAFSPWAGGARWSDNGESRVWLCSPTRILRVDENGASG
jgi:DNA ligase-associated metallophosphoesterase